MKRISKACFFYVCDVEQGGKEANGRKKVSSHCEQTDVTGKREYQLFSRPAKVFYASGNK